MKNFPFTAFRSSFSLKAPAKINWFLRVINKRDDGYHNIMSFMQCIAVFDILRFEHADTVEVTGDLNIPPKNNLVYMAAMLLKQHTSYKKGVKITLRKNIPVSAGLGGGSSDAAHTLLGLNNLWGLGLESEELFTIGLKIGSDVPFFLNGSPALVEGKGEKITNINLHSSPSVLLIVTPSVAVSTARVYASFDMLRLSELTKKPLDIKLFCHALVNRDFISLSSMIYNDLEKIAIKKCPVIEKIKARMLEKGAVISTMTGSGPTVFGIFESKKTALSAASKMGAHWSRVTETML